MPSILNCPHCGWSKTELKAMTIVLKRRVWAKSNSVSQHVSAKTSNWQRPNSRGKDRDFYAYSFGVIQSIARYPFKIATPRRPRRNEWVTAIKSIKLDYNWTQQTKQCTAANAQSSYPLMGSFWLILGISWKTLSDAGHPFGAEQGWHQK